MQDGIYKATFHVGPNSGSGIVTIRGTQVSGGDFGFFYFGELNDQSGQITAAITVQQHDASAQNVFAGLKSFDLSATGAAMTTTRARITGTTPAAPGQSVIVDLIQLAPL